MSILDVGDVKPYLRFQKDDQDSDLEGFLAAAEAAVANRVGPLVAEAQTVTVAGSGTTCLALPVHPLRSVTSVTGKSGSVVTLERTSLGAAVVYSETTFSESYYTVVCSVGHAADAASLPADLLKGVAELTRHLWMTQRGQGARSSQGDAPGSAYTWPIRVEQLLMPYMGPGFA